MTAQAGNLVVVSLDVSANETATLELIGSGRTTGFTISPDIIDVTNVGSTNLMQEFAEGGGVKRASTTMNLLVADRSHLQMIMDAAIAVTNLSLEIKLANLGSVTGSFLIENFELTGEYNDAATVSFTARSNGEFSFIKNTI